MGIIGDTPESGVRIDVARPREGGPPWRYEGEAVTSTGRLRLAATVSADGEVVVELGADEASEAAGEAGPPGAADPSSAATAERVRLLVRAAYKHARAEGGEGQPPPRRILRWRADADLAPPRRGE
jgi:hypothetical protein